MDEIQHIEAIGQFLANYHSDLQYISDFQKWKKDPTSDFESLKEFLKEYKVIRSINIGDKVRKDFADLTKQWVHEKEPDVDQFANEIKAKGLSHYKDNEVSKKRLPISLASKIMFLNNPCKYRPMDKFVKKAVDYKGKNYREFKESVDKYVESNSEAINDSLRCLEQFTAIIEKDKSELKDLDSIRRNRFIDKLLWTIGKK